MITKHTITEEDVRFMLGRYIIRLDNGKHDTKIANNISFYAEKRISLVTTVRDETSGKSETKYTMAGIWYAHSGVLTAEEFVKVFNSEGEDRYYRFMTRAEVDVLMDYIFSLKGLEL